MKVTVEELAPCKKKLHVEVPREEVEARFQELYQELRQKAQLPGFRPGRAPLTLLKARFGGYVRDQVLEKLLPEAYEKALEEANLKPALEPKVTDVKLEEGEAFVMEMEVETEPEFELDEGYKEIQVEEKSYSPSEEEVERFLERMREQKADLKDREDGVAREGDLVVIDYHVELEGEPVEGKKGEGMSLILGRKETVPGFEEGILGHKVGETFSVEVEFPEDHYDKDLAGKKGVFVVTLKEVKERILHELNDEFARTMGFDSLEDLRESVRRDLQAEYDRKAREEMVEQIKEQLLERYQFPLPPSPVEEKTAKRLDDEKFQYRLRGMDPDKANVDWEERRKELEKEVEKEVRFSFILGKIAKAEGIKVEEEELREEVEKVAQRLQRPLEEVADLMYRSGRLQGLSLDMLKERVIDFLLEKAREASSQQDEQSPVEEESGQKEEPTSEGEGE